MDSRKGKQPKYENQPQPKSQTPAQKQASHTPKPDKSLLRLENPIFQLKKKQQTEQEYVIRKLMERKEAKPKIQPVQRSPLLKELAAMMPIFRQANQELRGRVIDEKEKIDAKLELVEDSSSSSDSEQEDESKKVSKGSEMVDQCQEQQPQMKENTTNEIELNFLRYELTPSVPPTPVVEKQQQFHMEIKKEDSQGKGKGKEGKKLIQEL